MKRPRKLRLLPPVRQKLQNRYLLAGDNSNLVSAHAVVEAVAGKYPYHRSIAREVQRDLLCFCAVRGVRQFGCVEVELGKPYFSFERAIVDAWLEAGGRTWIIAEMEARAAERVIPFPVLAS